MTKLYTIDTREGFRPKENAYLEAHENDQSATDAFQSAFSDQKIIGWEEAYFGDCWLKTYEKPELDAEGHAELEGIKCIVQNPGSHPGENAYWLTPVDAVMIPVLQETDSME